MTTPLLEVGTAAARYAQLEPFREPYLTRARQAAALTIPHLMPPDGHGSGTPLPTPYQSMGARGVNNLTAKAVMALFPVNAPFFKLSINEATLEQMASTPDATLKSKVEEGLGKVEREVMSEIETSSIRTSASPAIKQLQVAGNVMLHLPDDGGMRVHRLDSYVVKRDTAGNLLEFVIREQVSPMVLEASLRLKVLQKLKLGLPTDKAESPINNVDLFTWGRRVGDQFRVNQEVCGEVIDKSRAIYRLDNLPYMALRWSKIDGEDYGRGHIEEYIGDLYSLDGLMQSILETTVAAAKLVFLVNPNGVTNIKTISKAPNGAVRAGKGEDVTTIQSDKSADLRVALETVRDLNTRLAQAFLLTSSIQRQAERVTAEEIKLLAGELDDTLGGVYSLLSQELQLQIVRRVMDRLIRLKRIPALDSKTVKPQITTGLEALGRGHELNRLVTWSRTVKEALGEQYFAELVEGTDYARRAGVSIGIEMKGLVKSAEDVAAKRQADMEQAQASAVAPHAMKMATAVATTSMKGQQDNAVAEAQPAGA